MTLFSQQYFSPLQTVNRYLTLQSRQKSFLSSRGDLISFIISIHNGQTTKKNSAFACAFRTLTRLWQNGLAKRVHKYSSWNLGQSSWPGSRQAQNPSRHENPCQGVAFPLVLTMVSNTIRITNWNICDIFLFVSIHEINTSIWELEAFTEDECIVLEGGTTWWWSVFISDDDDDRENIHGRGRQSFT